MEKGLERWLSDYWWLFQSSIPSTHVAAHNYNSSFRESNMLLWLQHALGRYVVHSQTCKQK